jgi:hypothetical protein
MEQIIPDQETRASQWEPRWAIPHATRRTQGGAPAHPDEPEEPDDDEEDDGGYPGITRPEMPATDRESVERPEKAPNPLNEPGA